MAKPMSCAKVVFMTGSRMLAMDPPGGVLVFFFLIMNKYITPQKMSVYRGASLTQKGYSFRSNILPFLSLKLLISFNQIRPYAYIN